MYLFTKYFHPANFVFADRLRRGRIFSGKKGFDIRIETAAPGVYHVEITNPSVWPEDFRIEPPTPAEARDGSPEPETDLTVTAGAGMALTLGKGRKLLCAQDGRWFGTCERAWLFRFEQQPDMEFYGLGEKHTPFERSGRAYRFWNVDAWADHPIERIEHGDYDPDYISIPYLIVKRRNTYAGLLADCPGAAMVSISDPAHFKDRHRQGPSEVLIGAEDGIPSLYCIVGPSLAALTRKLQRMTGVTPLPPLWALGFHQSRWGYRGDNELFALAEKFEAYRFPADGLWLDIDYMDGYRVFTFDAEHLPRPSETAAALGSRGFRVVPILDPGVKKEKGYGVYESGSEADVFCRTGAGTEFIGEVWPGLTVFPDFSLPEARSWWADHARIFFEAGFSGAWLDMNDPSTGSVDPTSMRFGRGRYDHQAFRNQYALLMAKATLEGYAAARPGRRPFLLSRSGCTGAQKYAAHWTGDNYSNYGHLHRSIGKSLNLALSGMPFNGPDVGGFGGDCTEALLVDWIKAAFLFPFLRNHTMRASRPQEPWAYSKTALSIIRHFVRLRYAFLPYLYNLFAEQEESGEAILRPLFYDFSDTDALALGRIDDQYLVGPFIMQAPFVEEKQLQRQVVLPDGRWLCGIDGSWLSGGRRTTASRTAASTPVFFREGGLVPFQPGIRTDNRCDLSRIGLLCCLSLRFSGRAQMIYRCDDGETYAYRKGKRSEIAVSARVEKGRLCVEAKTLSSGFGPVQITPYTVDRFSEVVFTLDGRARGLRPQEQTTRLSGEEFRWYRWK
ncbi:MAG: hypothetical protein K9L59_06965 [Desulfobacterales bacterium]|nr:hypothetical protein [Desulfobacterales bacterium]